MLIRTEHLVVLYVHPAFSSIHQRYSDACPANHNARAKILHFYCVGIVCVTGTLALCVKPF